MPHFFRLVNRLRFLALLPLAFAGPGYADAPELPPSFSVDSPVRAVTRANLYAVSQGHIWVKPVADAAQAPWALLGTGLPVAPPKDKARFHAPRAIQSISADDTDRLLAVSDEGLLYEYDQGKWTDHFGLPVAGLPRPLKLPPNAKAWSGSIRNHDVEYYEDPYGNQFNYGGAGCTSMYVLDAGGRVIHHGDPWFPADFSRQVCGPRQGAFVAENISSSASTIFLISRTGTLFTRLYDYDSNGGTPFFFYRYFDVPKNPYPGSAATSGYGTRGLPPEDWVEQPRIPTEGRARLTRNITVLQTGHGNSARELRVQGLGADGTSGIYFKNLLDTAWSFRPTGEPIAPADFIENRADAPAEAPPGLVMQGSLVRGKKRLPDLLSAETTDFTFHCSPFHLKLTLPSGKTLTLEVHTVDAWSLFVGEDPEANPFAYKKLKATLVLPREARESADPEIRKFVRRYLAHAHLKSFKYAIVANQKELIFYPVSYPLNPIHARWKLVLRADPGSRDQLRIALQPYSRLLPTLVDAATLAACPLRPEQRARLEGAAKALADARKETRHQLNISRLLGFGAPAVTSILDIPSIITTTRWTSRPITGLPAFEEHLPAVLSTATLSGQLFLEQSQADYDQTQLLLKSRLDATHCE